MNTKFFFLLMSVMLMPFFGMVEGLAYGASSVPQGDWDFCSPTNPCSNGQGDCDSDADCQQGLTCTSNVGPTFGWAKGIDVCIGIEDQATSNSSTSDDSDDLYGGPDTTQTVDNSSSGGLLDILFGSSTETPSSTVPSDNNSEWGCPYDPGDPDFCVTCRPNGCLEGEGQCNNWTQCADGLDCVNKVCVRPE